MQNIYNKKALPVFRIFRLKLYQIRDIISIINSYKKKTVSCSHLQNIKCYEVKISFMYIRKRAKSIKSRLKNTLSNKVSIAPVIALMRPPSERYKLPVHI